MRKNSLILTLLLTASAWGQEIPTILVREVVVTGNDRASAQVIESTSKIYVGRSVTMMDIQQGIRRMWALGFFSDIQVFLDDEDGDGGTIRIDVAEYPSLEKIEFDGNDKLKDKKLLEEIGLSPPAVLSDYAISEAVRKIRNAYHEDGYLDVEVNTALEPGDKPHGRILKIAVVEHKKIKLRKVKFEGNDAVRDIVLRFQMKETKPWKWYAFWRSPFDRDKYETDLAALIIYYRNKGYRDARIVQDSVAILPGGKGMSLTITIEEGLPYYYRNITWEGNVLHDDDRLAAALGFERGDLYSKEAFEMAVAQRVHPIYMDDGYLYSQINPVEFPVGEDSVDVVFNVVENQKVSVRYIHVNGNDKTRDYVVRRELRIHPGETFSYEKLTRSQRDVWILNYFENVEPNVIPVDEDEVDLSITVTERSSDRANLSLGYTEQNGFIGGGGVEFNNLLGMGQKLSINYQRGTQFQFGGLGGAQAAAFQSFSLSLSNPWMFNTPNLVGASVFYSERGTGQYLLPFDITQWGGSARWGRRFRWPDNFFRGSWIFQAGTKNYFGTSGDKDATYDLLKQYLSGLRLEDIETTKDGRYFSSSVGISITQVIARDSRDRPEFPTQGSQFELLSTLSGIFLGGNEDFQKHVVSLKWYSPVAARKLVFFQMAKIGYIEQVKGGEGRSVLPPDEKFYLGGTGVPFGEMLRGYKSNTIGPYANGPLGASVMLKYSAELRLSISSSPTVYALVFADMGNAWFDLRQTDPFNLKRSLGVGVRLFMPMLGMLGLDIGYGFDSVATDRTKGARGWETHFIFGQPF